MKKNLLTPIVALSLAATALLSSCEKEEYDLDNIGDNILFNTSLAAPIIAERDISLIDFFDMDVIGKFKFTIEQQDQVEKVIEVLGTQRGYAWPKCLQQKDDGKYVIDLSLMTGKDIEDLQDLGITIDEKYLPNSKDFVEIDDLDKTFGEGNAINEIDEFELRMDINNRTDFKIMLSIEFAKTIQVPTPNGIEEQHVAIEGTKGESNSSSSIEIRARESGIQTLTFKNIAQKIKDNNATGLLITYELSQDKLNSFTIKATDGLTMSLKAFVRATIDLSNINN